MREHLSLSLPAHPTPACTLNPAPASLACRLRMHDEGKLEELYGIKPGQVQVIRARWAAVPSLQCVVHECVVHACSSWTVIVGQTKSLSTARILLSSRLGAVWLDIY